MLEEGRALPRRFGRWQFHPRLRALLLLHRRQPSCLDESHGITSRVTVSMPLHRRGQPLLLHADGVDDEPQGLPRLHVLLPRTTIAELHAYRHADAARHGDVEQKRLTTSKAYAEREKRREKDAKSKKKLK